MLCITLMIRSCDKCLIHEKKLLKCSVSWRLFLYIYSLINLVSVGIKLVAFRYLSVSVVRLLMKFVVYLVKIT